MFAPNVSFMHYLFSAAHSNYLFQTADWEMWAAAIASPSTKSMFISKLATWIGITQTDRAFTDLYNTQTAE